MAYLKACRDIPAQDAADRPVDVRRGFPDIKDDRISHLSLRGPETGRVCRWIDRGLIDTAGHLVNRLAVEQLGAKGVCNA